MPRLILYLLGPPRIELDGEEVHIGRRKMVALLAYLAVTGERHRRDSLATLLWPEYDQSRALAYLRRILSMLNTTLGGGWLATDRETAGLNPDARIWLDVDAFRQHLATCETHGHPATGACPDCIPSLEEAVALYRDDFLAGFTLSDSAAFDEWQFFQTEGPRRKLALALERLVQAYGAQGECEAALRYARRWLALDPLHEPAHRRLMGLYAQAGQQSAALRQYEECVRILEAELGLSPSQETTSLYERIRTGLTEGRISSSKARHNLPVQPTPFIGREPVLANIKARLDDPNCRLLTLVGPGGCGKTRLALEAAAAQLDGFEHGVFFVSLAPLRSAEGIASVIAQAIGFSFYAGDDPQQQLLDYLCQRHMLLVLDNFEHLLDGVGLVTQVLASAPEVKLLVTSRTRLQVQAEYPCAVTGMSCPAQELVADAGQYSAIKLFLDSGRRARSDFELTAENAPDVVCICNLVAGMPLGIVLAAGWLEILTPAEIADQISADTGPGLDFLEADLRDLPQRQRSMRAVFDHSWRLLAEREQEVFQGLAVFRGGFSQQGAQAVTGATLRDLKRLVGKSLLQRASARLYEVHELLRQYVEEKLNQQPGVGEAARDRHSEYYTGAVAQWWEDIKGPRQRAALAEMAAEFQNVRAAWDWAAERGRVELLNQALEGLCEFCWQRAWQEGLAACQIAAEKLASMETLEPDGQRVLARIWIRQANYNGYLNHTELAAQQVQQGLKLLDGLERADQDVRRERAYALLTIGGVISANREEREQLYEQSLTLYRAVDDRYWTGFVLFSSSMITDHFSEARQLIGQALEICEDLGSITLATYSVCGLGYIALAEGELEKAERFLRQALPDAQESGSQQAIAFALGPLGITLVCGGRFAEGYALLQENRAVINDLGWSFMVGEAQTGLSLVKMHLGQYDEARLQLPVDYAQGAGNQARSFLALGSLDFALGSLELTEGAYGEAHQLLQEGVAQEREFGYLWYLAGHLAVLGYAARGLGQPSEAKQHLVEALEIVAEYGVYLMLTYTFPLAALLLADQGEVERAVEIYALALNYPFVANSKWFDDVAGQHIAAVAATLPPEVVATAQERGRARDVDDTVAELLAEFGG